MRESKSIIQSLKNYPQFAKMRLFECFNELKVVLPFNLQKGIKLIYKKNSIIFIVLKHNIYLMEMRYKLKDIKKLIKQLQKIYPDECEDIKDIKLFVTTKYADIKEPEYKDTNPKYIESSKGNFENLAKDREIREIFEDIKKIISSK